MIIDIAARRRIARGWRILRRADDFVIGEDEGRAIRLWHRRTRHSGIGTICTNHAKRTNHALLASLTILIGDDASPVFIARQIEEGSITPFSTGLHRALTQELIEMFAVNHADETIFDRHIDGHLAGRNHARRADLGAELRVRNIKVADRAWRNGTTTWLDPACAIKQQNMASGAGEIGCCCRARRPAANNNHIEMVCAHAACSTSGVKDVASVSAGLPT